jgi:glutamate/tyrosine decarboxylase-like PLP-dependent enzyme
VAATDPLNTRFAPCDLAPDEFRAIGHSLVDSIADFLGGIRELPTASGLIPDSMRSVLGRREMPLKGQAIAPVIEEFRKKFFAHSTQNGSPRFFGYITSSAAPVGMLADMLAASVNPNCGAWALSPVATEVENETIRWLTEFMGLPGTWDGIMVSGGNMANMVGFTAARTAKAGWDIRENGLTADDARRLVLYTSKETHTWINKASDLGGLGTSAVRWIPTDHELRMRTDLLEEAIADDLAAGLAPFMVVGTAGTVGTGAIDPLPAISRICKKYNLWFHVDGAYGAPAVALPDASEDLKGLRLADSIAIDPHKWLYSPLEAGCILTRHASALRDAFSFKPHYYQFDDNEGQEVRNYFEHGPQNSRGFRALKIWLVFQQIGADGYRRMLADEIALAHRLHEMLEGHESLERGTVSLSITTFRYVPHDLHGAPDDGSVTTYLNELNERIVTAIRLSGEAFVSNTFLDGRFMLRTCIVNFRTTLKDVAMIPDLVVRIGGELDAKFRPAQLKATRRRRIRAKK